MDVAKPALKDRAYGAVCARAASKPHRQECLCYSTPLRIGIFQQRQNAPGRKLIQTVLLSFVEQRLAADAKNRGALADLVMRGIERGPDGVALHVFERFQGDPQA